MRQELSAVVVFPMSGIGTGYDLSATTYSPDGRVFQAEYACKAVDNSATTIGVRCKDGVVVAAEKQVVSKMAVKGSVKRVVAVDRHAGMASAGLQPDGRQVVGRARDECSNYKSFYGGAMPGSVLADRLASYMHLFTLYWSVRPLGTTVLLATRDKEAGAALYMVEPSGVSHRYRAAACGKGRQGIKTELERLDLDTLTCREAVAEIAKLLEKNRDEGQKKEYELEMSWICEESGNEFKAVPQEMVKEAVAAAIAAIEQEEMDDD